MIEIIGNLGKIKFSCSDRIIKEELFFSIETEPVSSFNSSSSESSEFQGFDSNGP
jgi:hypothetical protein